jgi:hypothetical protein
MRRHLNAYSARDKNENLIGVMQSGRIFPRAVAASRYFATSAAQTPDLRSVLMLSVFDAARQNPETNTAAVCMRIHTKAEYDARRAEVIASPSQLPDIVNH